RFRQPGLPDLAVFQGDHRPGILYRLRFYIHLSPDSGAPAWMGQPQGGQGNKAGPAIGPHWLSTAVEPFRISLQRGALPFLVYGGRTALYRAIQPGGDRAVPAHLHGPNIPVPRRTFGSHPGPVPIGPPLHARNVSLFARL